MPGGRGGIIMPGGNGNGGMPGGGNGGMPGGIPEGGGCSFPTPLLLLPAAAEPPPAAELRGASPPPSAGQLESHSSEGGDKFSTMSVVIEESPSDVEQHGGGGEIRCAFASRGSPCPALGGELCREVKQQPESQRSAGSETPPPSLRRRSRAVVTGVAASSEFVEDQLIRSSRGTAEFHRTFSIATEMENGGQQMVLVSPRSRRTTAAGDAMPRGSSPSGSVSGQSPQQGASRSGSLDISSSLPVLSAEGVGTGLGPPSAPASVAASACLSPTRANIASRSMGTTFTGTSTASSMGDADEYDRVCGVCLDAGDFIATLPCNHKICGGYRSNGAYHYCHLRLQTLF